MSDLERLPRGWRFRYGYTSGLFGWSTKQIELQRWSWIEGWSTVDSEELSGRTAAEVKLSLWSDHLVRENSLYHNNATDRSFK